MIEGSVGLVSLKDDDTDVEAEGTRDQTANHCKMLDLTAFHNYNQ